MSTVVGVGNCQLRGMVEYAARVLGLTPVYVHPDDFDTDPRLLLKHAANAEVVFVQRVPRLKKIHKMLPTSGRPTLPVLLAPRLYFPGFHPDFTTPVKAAGKTPTLPLGTANSAILLQAWRDGLSAQDALTLFRHEVYEALGYYDVYDMGVELLADECRHTGIDVRPFVSKWLKSGPYFYAPTHPKIDVLCDVASALLRKARLYSGEAEEPVVEDRLFDNVIWPVYPEIAARLGVPGDYIFRPKHWSHGTPETAPLSLEEFVDRSFAGYRQGPPNFAAIPRMDDPRLKSLRSFVGGQPAYEDAFGSADWLEDEASHGKNVICDEELLDRPDEIPGA